VSFLLQWKRKAGKSRVVRQQLNQNSLTLHTYIGTYIHAFVHIICNSNFTVSFRH
jgi:hypothetical protein